MAWESQITAWPFEGSRLGHLEKLVSIPMGVLLRSERPFFDGAKLPANDSFVLVPLMAVGSHDLDGLRKIGLMLAAHPYR